MGRRGRRSRSRLWAAVALLGGARRAVDRPDPGSGGDPQDQSRQPPDHRHGLEPRRAAGHGASTLSLPVPVLRGRGAPLLSVVPALRRCFPGGAVQYRQLRPAHHDDCAGHGPQARGVRPYLRRRTPLPNHLDQADLQLSRTPRTLPKMRLNPEVTNLFRFGYEDFELSGYDPHPHIAAEVSVWVSGVRFRVSGASLVSWNLEPDT